MKPPQLLPSRLWRFLAQRAFQRAHPDAPLLVSNAVLLLDRWLRPADVGIEWGSGRSTTWLASRLARLVAVEHDSVWYRRVRRRLQEKGLAAKVDYRRVPSPVEQMDEPRGHAYAAVADELEDASLDLALVDGQMRLRCMQRVIPKLRPGGLLVLDGANRYLPNRFDGGYTTVQVTRSEPLTHEWSELLDRLRGWRAMQTSDGLWDTRLWVKPSRGREGQKPIRSPSVGAPTRLGAREPGPCEPPVAVQHPGQYLHGAGLERREQEARRQRKRTADQQLRVLDPSPGLDPAATPEGLAQVPELPAPGPQPEPQPTPTKGEGQGSELVERQRGSEHEQRAHPVVEEDAAQPIAHGEVGAPPGVLPAIAEREARRAGSPLVVGDRRGLADESFAEGREAEPELHVLQVDEVALVEAAGLAETLPIHERAGRREGDDRRRFRLELRQRNPSLAEPHGPDEVHVAPVRLDEVRFGKQHQARHHRRRSLPGPGLQEQTQAIRRQVDVVVDEEHRRRGDAPESLVAGRGRSQVLAQLDQHDVREAQADRLGAAVRRAVVHDDRFGQPRPLRLELRQAAEDLLAAVVVDDDCARAFHGTAVGGVEPGTCAPAVGRRAGYSACASKAASSPARAPVRRPVPATVGSPERETRGVQADVTGDVTIRRAGDVDMGVLADNFRRMWLEIGWSPETLRGDWADVVAAFVERARSAGDFAAFVAEADAGVVGTAACQIFSGLYPEIRLPTSHLAGYVWGVYVRPDHRRRGLATRLTRAALDHLDALGCTVVRLHASRHGEPVYRAMGFRGTNELELDATGAFRTPP